MSKPTIAIENGDKVVVEVGQEYRIATVGGWVNELFFGDDTGLYSIHCIVGVVLPWETSTLDFDSHGGGANDGTPWP